MRATVAVLWLVAGTACGDALVGPGYHGEPLVQIEGRIADYRMGAPEPGGLKASVMWSLTGDTTLEASALIEQPNVAVAVTFPSTFKINLFEEPADPAFAGMSEPYLVGQIIVYEDTNQDTRYSPGELRGGAYYNSLLFTAQAVAAVGSPTGSELPVGFSLVELPLPCAQRPAPRPDLGNDCGVELGAACASHAACGTRGHCLKTNGYIPYPGGYCVLTDDSGCIPADGVEDFVDIGDVAQLVWIKACQHPDECREDYQCPPWLGACVPQNPVFLDIDPEFEFQPLCGGSDWAVQSGYP